MLMYIWDMTHSYARHDTLQCLAVGCSVLQCIAVSCSRIWFRHIYILMYLWDMTHSYARHDTLQCVAVSCSVLQYVAVCCSVLQCVAVCCSVFTILIHTHDTTRCGAQKAFWMYDRVIFWQWRCLAADIHMGHTGWWRLIGCLKLQVIFRKRATNYRALLWKTTYEDKASYDSTPPCNSFIWACNVYERNDTLRCAEQLPLGANM